MDIRGWRKNLGEIASFYFTSLATRTLLGRDARTTSA
jgi:hypothetical protein